MNDGSGSGSSTQHRIETLMQKWEVTEWRDGCVAKTNHVGNEWRPLNAPMTVTEGDSLGTTTYVYSPMPTSYAIDHQTIRTTRPDND